MTNTHHDCLIPGTGIPETSFVDPPNADSPYADRLAYVDRMCELNMQGLLGDKHFDAIFKWYLPECQQLAEGSQYKCNYYK